MVKFFEILNIPINNILHDNKPVRLKEGHGGKTVEHWPIYHFFKVYNSGNKEEAQKTFMGWYFDQFKKYSEVPKSQGGLKGGSLYRFYQRQKESTSGNFSFEDAVRERVKERFLLFESIRENGYIPNEDDQIKVLEINKNQFILLSGGHHRVAIMAALGFPEVPRVFVYKNKQAFIINKYLEKGKLLLKFK